MAEDVTLNTEGTDICADLYDKAVEITGLADTLCFVTVQTVLNGDFKEAQKLAWAYKCLGDVAYELARRLSDAAP